MLLAAVDLGSNSFRLEIGRVSPHDGALIERHGYWKETLRLAAGLEQDHRLSQQAIHHACECLARMNERLRGIAAHQVRAVGTQTLRLARNIDDFLLQAQHALGYPIEVISGREEARLVFEGCMHTLPPSNQRRLVVDIGGASTELSIGQGFVAQSAESFPVGCVNTSVRFFKDGQMDRASFKKAQIAAAAQLEEGVATFARAQWDEAFGSSGTIGAVSAILRAQGWSDGTITSEGLLKLKQGLLQAGQIKHIEFAGLTPDRQEVIAGGVAVLTAVFETLGLTELRPARGALRVGVLYDLLGRRESRDVRDVTVERLQTRLGIDRGQAAQVAQIAHDLFIALHPHADEPLLQGLHWAAQLHESGLALSHYKPHRHGAYLVEHADLAGFSITDQARMAQLILGQRGNLRKVHGLLNDPARTAQLLALRLATVFAHARRAVNLPHWTLQASRGAIDLGLQADWLARHRLTAHLLEEEAEHWAKVGVRMNVEKI